MGSIGLDLPLTFDWKAVLPVVGSGLDTCALCWEEEVEHTLAMCC